MANIKSAKKRIAVTARRTMENKRIKSSTKTAIKKMLVAVDSGDKPKAIEAHKVAVKSIDQATAKGIFHKNTASRKKSQLAKRLNGYCIVCFKRSATRGVFFAYKRKI